MRLRFLGTGTSFGIPVIGCRCDTCTSADPRDRRTRHGALLEDEHDGRRLLVDAPPELRLQLLREGIDRIDAIWFTHCHADHIHGIDDLRAFSARAVTPIPALAGPECARTLRYRFAYVFDTATGPPAGTTRPELHLEAYHDGEPVDVAGFRLVPLAVPHAGGSAFGFRAGGLGYITDAKDVPEAARARLRGVRVLVLNALWRGKPHPTHLTVEEAVDVARDIGAEATYLTHLSHRVRHAELLECLPRGVEPAYDGLVVEI